MEGTKEIQCVSLTPCAIFSLGAFENSLVLWSERQRISE